MAWRSVFVVLVWTTVFSNGNKLFPQPSLTEDRSARVLKLECTPPPEAAYDWQDVHDIRVFVCLRDRHPGNCKNYTIANMTSAMTTPRLGSSEAVPSIAKVSFAGHWEPTGHPSLTVEMPLTSKNYGVYLCTAQYENSKGLHHYSVGISVNSSSDTRRGPLKKDNFEIRLIKAHAVTVTWSLPDSSQFLEGRVTRSLVDREGKAIAAPRSLFMATDTKDFVYDNAGVLLTRFQTPSSTRQNYSMTVYVESKGCSPYCGYSCSVLYPACVGPDARFCECNHQDNVAPPTASAELSDGDIAAICLALISIVLIVLVILLLCKKRLNSCHRVPSNDREEKSRTAKEQVKSLLGNPTNIRLDESLPPGSLEESPEVGGEEMPPEDEQDHSLTRNQNNGTPTPTRTATSQQPSGNVQNHDVPAHQNPPAAAADPTLPLASPAGQAGAGSQNDDEPTRAGPTRGPESSHTQHQPQQDSGIPRQSDGLDTDNIVTVRQ